MGCRSLKLRNMLYLGFIFLIISSFGDLCQAQEAPRLNPFAFPKDLTIGSRAKVLCSAYLGDPPLDFQWRKDGRPLNNIGKVQQLAQSVSELDLDPLKIQHIGNYTCIVKNSHGSDEVTSHLFLKAPPSWLKEPSDVKVGVGGKVIMDCQASGSPPVKISWKRRSPTLGELVDITSSNRLQIMANNSLLITNAQKSEDGQYTCEAGNGVGETLRKSIQIVVFDFPSVQRLADHVTVERSGKTILSCLANGDMPLLLTWSRNGKLLSEWPDTFNRVTFADYREGDATKFMMTISPTEMYDEGLYICTAKNDFGSDEKEIRLLLVEKPKIPDTIEVIDIWSRSARISWSTPSNGNTPILGYTVEYWSSTGTHLNETVTSSSNSCILRNLNPFTLYKLQLWAINSVGASDPSKQVQFTTSKEEPSAAPTDLAIEDTGSTFVRLSWKPPPFEDWNGGITGYYIGYKQSSSQNPYTYNTVESEEESIHYVLRGLRRATSYTISVRAFNEVGSGPHSQELSFRTHNHEPPPRPSLMIRSIGSTHLQLQWFIPEDAKKSAIGYTLHYKTASHFKWQEIVIPDSLQQTFTLTNLESGVTYQVFITTESSLGASEPSDVATVQTMAEQIYQPSTPDPMTAQGSMDEFTQTLYIVVPIAVATVIIVLVIVIACVYVYSRRPITIPQSYVDILPDKNFTYMSTVPRHREPQSPICGMDHMPKQGSPYSTVPLTRCDPEDEEPIYESVMEEIRCKIKQRAFEEQLKIGSGTIV